MHRLVQKLESDWPPSVWSKTRVLIAVSGGADSVALLLALHALSPDDSLLHVAHYNHRWRGDESDSDAQFVSQFSETLGVPATIGTAAAGSDNRSEASARDERYDFLRRTAYATGCRYVVTAHTSSDRCETVLHNVFRGTGLSGMVGPQRRRALDEQLVLVRPLLSCSRKDITDYLQFCGQDYREDSSNQDQSFRRNFIRHQVLPTVRAQYGEGVDRAIVNLSTIAEETLGLIEGLASEYLEKAQAVLNDTSPRTQLGVETSCKTGFQLPNLATLPVHWSVLQAAIKRLWAEQGWPLQSVTRQHWLTVRELFEASTSKFSAPAHLHTIQLPGIVTVTATATTVRFERAR